MVAYDRPLAIPENSMLSGQRSKTCMRCGGPPAALASQLGKPTVAGELYTQNASTLRSIPSALDVALSANEP